MIVGDAALVAVGVILIAQCFYARAIRIGWVACQRCNLVAPDIVTVASDGGGPGETLCRRCAKVCLP